MAKCLQCEMAEAVLTGRYDAPGSPRSATSALQRYLSHKFGVRLLWIQRLRINPEMSDLAIQVLVNEAIRNQKVHSTTGWKGAQEKLRAEIKTDKAAKLEAADKKGPRRHGRVARTSLLAGDRAVREVRPVHASR